MKFIIFSDVHSNLESLQSFCGVTEPILHDKKVCLGDIVGYNADPNPVVEWIRDKTDFALAGNHDYSVLNKTDASYLNPAAYQASLWTRRNLTNSNKDFLNTLPIEKEEGGIYWVHSSPFEPKKWHYVSTKKSAEKNFNYFDQAICFLGHSHLPGIFEKNKIIRCTHTTRLKRNLTQNRVISLTWVVLGNQEMEIQTLYLFSMIQ